jgi:ATP-dependent Clp protease protease subunit
VLALHTGHTVEEIARDSDRDRWFTADEAKDYGMIDHVIAHAADIPLVGATS